MTCISTNGTPGLRSSGRKFAVSTPNCTPNCRQPGGRHRRLDHSSSFQADYDLNCDIVSGILRREPSVDFKPVMRPVSKGSKTRRFPRLRPKLGGFWLLMTKRPCQSTTPEFVRRDVSPGVIIVPQSLQVRDTIDELLLIWAASDAEEWRNVIEYLPL